MSELRGPEAAKAGLCVGFFCDSHGRGGVFTYTCRLARELRRHGIRVEIFTCPPRTAGARRVVDELRASGDGLSFWDTAQGPASLARQALDAFRRLRIDVFVPNYRRLVYAACAAASRSRDT